MPRTRKNHPPSLKAKVAVEAIRANRTTAEIAQMFGVHPTQVGGWKKQALAVSRPDEKSPFRRTKIPQPLRATVRVVRDFQRATTRTLREAAFCQCLNSPGDPPKQELPSN